MNSLQILDLKQAKCGLVQLGMGTNGFGKMAQLGPLLIGGLENPMTLIMSLALGSGKSEGQSGTMSGVTLYPTLLFVRKVGKECPM